MPASSQLRGAKNSDGAAGAGQSLVLCEPGKFAGTGLSIHALRIMDYGRQLNRKITLNLGFDCLGTKVFARTKLGE
jgi:hypothetical protein